MQLDRNFNPHNSQIAPNSGRGRGNSGYYYVQPSRVANHSAHNLNNRRKSKQQLKQDEEKRLNKAFRIIYKGGDLTKLTDDAMHACERLKIKPDDLMMRNVEWFQARATREEANALVETRFQHYARKRKSK